ncbi:MULTISPECIES: hypothetical protein [unclassified Methanoculleus]|nr:MULTISPECIES: hypothetical protein [unclassified Methanoculleus]
MSTEGAEEEREARVVGVTGIHYNVETGEGETPSHLTVLKLASLALPT